MPEKNVSAGGSSANGASREAEIRIYERERAKLRDILGKQEDLKLKLAEINSRLEEKENTYFEENTSGNIIEGYDSFLKGGSTAEAKRRRTRNLEQLKIFTRSNLSYNPHMQAVPTPASATSTPASHAPTPHSASFARGDTGSGHPTPASAGPSTKSNKRSKKNEEDSETDHKEAKKARSNGSSRK